MRTTEITLAGKKCLLAFNLEVSNRLEEDNISLSEISQSNIKTTTMTKLIVCMANAGAHYAELFKLGAYDEITTREVEITVDFDEGFSEIQDAVMRTIVGNRTVNAEPPKNAEATRGEDQIV